MAGGPIIALDLGVRTGVAVGEPGEAPKSFVWDLKGRGEGREFAFASLIARLDDTLRSRRPRLIFKEQPFALGAFAARGNAGATVVMAYGLHAIVEGVCQRFRIPCHERAAATIRKHFIDRARIGERSATKRAVVARCHLLGYLDRACTDDDRADACAAWDFACAHLAKVPPRALHLFGETADVLTEPLSGALSA